MRARRARGLWAVAALACAVALAGGCSGGGGGGSTGTTAPPPPPALQITTTALPHGVKGGEYSETFQAIGGKAPYTWSATAALPFGLSLSPSGVLSGTLQGSGNGFCEIQVTDSSFPPHVLGQAFIFESEQVLVLPAEAFTDPNVGQSYTAAIDPLGGSPPLTWTLVSGQQTLPPGLAFTNNGSGAIVGGVPTTAGMFNFTVQASEVDAPYQMAQNSFSLTVTNVPVITTGTLPDGVINKAYQATLQAIVGTPPYTWSASPTALASGLTLDPATGVISGTPTESGTYGGAFTVTDSGNPPQSNTRSLYISINPALHFTGTSLPNGVVAQGYYQGIPVQGGLKPYTASVQGTLPDGTTLTGAAITGTPTTAGTWDFTLTVDDAESPPASIQQAFSIHVNPQLVMENAQPPSAIVGVPYSYQFQATGGVPPYVWGANLPPGLTIDSSTGLMSGTPTMAAVGPINVSVSDSGSPLQNANFDEQYFFVYGQLKVITSSLPAVAVNVPVKMVLNAAGGAGHYTWSNPSGGLPTGLTMDSTGVISGQTTAAGNFTFTAEVNDPGPPAQTADQTLELTVGSPGRNDTPATATPLSDGTYAASISPIADPPNGTIAPDTDYYKLAANPGAIVTVEITAARLTPPSPLDSVLEFVDSNGNRLSLCSSDPMNTSAGPFASGCMNDDITELNTTDSRLTLQVPSGNSGPLTFYAHVLDWRGDARPDMVYTITISGAN